jgi:hypothetical protein
MEESMRTTLLALVLVMASFTPNSAVAQNDKKQFSNEHRAQRGYGSERWCTKRLKKRWGIGGNIRRFAKLDAAGCFNKR